MTTSNDQQTALQLAARHLVEAQETTAKLGRMSAYRVHEVQGVLGGLSGALNSLGSALEAAGASAPTEGYQGTPPPAPDSLEALRRIEQSRSEGQALLATLQAALPVAEALDYRRGNWVGDLADTAHGETPGTNYAEAVQELLLRLTGELGVKGSGRE